MKRDTNKKRAVAKIDISFPVTQEEYEYYREHELTHHDYYRRGQTETKKERVA